MAATTAPTATGTVLGYARVSTGHQSIEDALWDVPASRHEAACASGSVAVLAAIADLRSGAYDSALVVG
ncbi:hypothetical protein BV510_18945, partial [Mycolicibacterium diernhoferi]